jgi:hypothetical protein
MPALAPFRQQAYAHITIAEDVPRAPGRSLRSSNEANVGENLATVRVVVHRLGSSWGAMLRSGFTAVA